MNLRPSGWASPNFASPGPASVDIPPDLVADKGALRDAVAVVLYKQIRLTILQARSIMGLSRREVEEQIASVVSIDAPAIAHDIRIMASH